MSNIGVMNPCPPSMQLHLLVCGLSSLRREVGIPRPEAQRVNSVC